MPLISFVTQIHAPIELCFDLARSIELHVRSTQGTDEKPVAGVMSGLIGLDQEVTWEATHFGVRQRLTSRITAFDRPHSFRDSQVRGIFRRFDHDHLFSTEMGVTVMKDVFDYDGPLGLLGKLADVLFLEQYMRKLLQKRASVIKEAAEAGEKLS